MDEERGGGWRDRAMENGGTTEEGPLAAALAGFEASRPGWLVHLASCWRTRFGRHKDFRSTAALVGTSAGASVVQLSFGGASQQSSWILHSRCCHCRCGKVAATRVSRGGERPRLAPPKVRLHVSAAAAALSDSLLAAALCGIRCSPASQTVRVSVAGHDRNGATTAVTAVAAAAAMVGAGVV